MFTMCQVAAAPLYPDGSSGAPSGTPQYPHLVDTNAGTNTNGVAFNVRPPWNVAGVDYRVGINTGVSLTAVTSSLPSGFSLDTANKQVLCSGSGNYTINGYDFSAAANGGTAYRLNYTGSGSLTVTNCNFQQRAIGATGGCLIFAFGATGFLTVSYCQFDGNGAAMNLSDDLMMVQVGVGGGLIEYNWFKNGVSDAINIVGKSGDISSIVVQYNFAESLGLGAPTFGADSAHADFLQSYCLTGGTGTNINGLACKFNCVYQPTASNNGAGCGVPVGMDALMLLQAGSPGAGGAGAINSPECGYNTCVGIGGTHYFWQGGAGHNTGAAWDEWITLQGSSGNPINNPYIHDNYIYANTTFGTGLGFTNGFAFYPSSGQFIVSQTYARNINMYDGTSFTTNP